MSPNLNDITNMIIKIGNEMDVNVLSTRDDNIFINDVIFSGHYKIDEFKYIYTRRRNRMINVIKHSKNILF